MNDKIAQRIFLTILGLLVLGFPANAQTITPTPRTFYVHNATDTSTTCNPVGDNITPSDTNNGTSPSTPWSSIHKVNASSFNPGDKILFREGCSWTTVNSTINTGLKNLNASWNGTASAPITFGSYTPSGASPGNKPLFKADANKINDPNTPGDDRSTYETPIYIDGNYQIFENLRVITINHHQEPTCTLDGTTTGIPAKQGWYAAFTLYGSHNSIRNVEVSDLAVGVTFHDSSSTNKVLNSYFHDLNTFTRIYNAGGALGAIGVNLHGQDHEVAYNRFEAKLNLTQCQQTSAGPSPGTIHNYSAPLELYNANRTYTHHNQAYGHRKHFEMGKDEAFPNSADNVVAYNLFVSDQPRAVGPNIHAACSDPTNCFGPIERTQVYNNTIVFTGLDSQAIVAGAGGTFRNNIFVAEWKAAYYGNGTTESNNLYWDYNVTTDSTPDPCIQLPGAGCQNLNNTTTDQDPKFVNSAVPSGNFRLTLTSPAVNQGLAITTSACPSDPSLPCLKNILTTDLVGSSIPQGSNPDMGAYEFITATPTNTPTAAPPPPQNTPTPTPVSTPLLPDIRGLLHVIKDFGKLGSPGFLSTDLISNGFINIFDFNALIASIVFPLPSPTPTTTVTADAIVTINKSSVIATSQFSPGITHADDTLKYPWGSNNQTAVNNAKQLINNATNFQNTHVMAWGALDPWPDPQDPGPTNWAHVDKRVLDAADAGAIPMITLCEAPWWMKGSLQADGSTKLIPAETLPTDSTKSMDFSSQTLTAPYTDFRGISYPAGYVSPDPYAARILDSQMAKWDQLVEATARRYMVAPYNVRYFQVWNELKGYYNPDINRWDHTTTSGDTAGYQAKHGYTYLYNRTYDKLITVAQSLGIPAADIKIGGPYPVIATWTKAKAGGFPATETLLQNKSYGTFDQRDLDAVKYWLTNKRGARFIAIDMSNRNRPESGSEPSWITDPFTSNNKFPDIINWIRSLSPTSHPGATTLPIIFSEWYSNPPQSTDPDFNNAVKADAIAKIITTGGRTTLQWGAVQNTGQWWTNASFHTNTNITGGGQPLPWYQSYKAFKDYFNTGTPIYHSQSSSPDIDVISGPTKTILINKTSSAKSVAIQSTVHPLAAYEVRVVNTP